VTTVSDQDIKPWYRQFWPWFLICLPASAVIASLYTVSLAVRTTDSLVVSSDDGMDVVAGRHLAAERRARTLGLGATVRFDMGSGAIVATLTADTNVDWPTSLELLLSHPAFGERDRTIALTRSLPDESGNPTWSGHFLHVPDGRWYLVLEDGDTWRLNGTWSGEGTAQLVPASADADDGG
jgi:hypothetical protein